MYEAITQKSIVIIKQITATPEKLTSLFKAPWVNKKLINQMFVDIFPKRRKQFSNNLNVMEDLINKSENINAGAKIRSKPFIPYINKVKFLLIKNTKINNMAPVRKLINEFLKTGILLKILYLAKTAPIEKNGNMNITLYITKLYIKLTSLNCIYATADTQNGTKMQSKSITNAIFLFLILEIKQIVNGNITTKQK